MLDQTTLQNALVHLVLLLPADQIEVSGDAGEETSNFLQSIRSILAGNSCSLLHNDSHTITNNDTQGILSEFPDLSLRECLDQVIDSIFGQFETRYGENSNIYVQLWAIALLQAFIQANFTGPAADFDCGTVFFGENSKRAQQEALKLLAIEGQTAYGLMVDPLMLVVALMVFEKMGGVGREHSAVGRTGTSIGSTVDATNEFVSRGGADFVQASHQWWRARALQVHASVLSEPTTLLASVTSVLMSPRMVQLLSVGEFAEKVQLIFFLECARNSIHAQTEHLAMPFLSKAKDVSQLHFVLSGAKAKRTKFQTFHTSALVLLAKSAKVDATASSEKPESFKLDSDLLLEKPEFEALEDVQEPETKKQKFDDEEEERLLPIARTQDEIPEDLKQLDPNSQPVLNDLDNIQLLLRLTTLKQTSPSGNALVEEELLAIVSRILYAESSPNWSVFGRALWERSLLETNKARTIERGILQMTSLVEEIGIKIKTRMLPGQDDIDIASRLRFIHQLPLMPQWTMDVKLAEKYVSIGVLRSAIDIYERLDLVCELALCYAALENEAKAEEILAERVEKHPEDARALSILGDIKQDPLFWMKAWEIGHYAKAKASLCHYYYAPPASSGLTKNIDVAIQHMNECLGANPLSYENWFFYGCCGLETSQFELASEAFTRCVALDDTNSLAWSNLSSALLKTDKVRPAFNALKKAIRSAGEGKKSWRIYENYLIVAAKLGEWNDVLLATREIISIRSSDGEVMVDIPVLEKLTEILVATEYPSDRLSHYQSSCIDLICNILPGVVSTARCWRLVSKVEMWRHRPWQALECHEKAYRALSQKPDLETDESVWNEAVDACSDLVAAYENYGDLPGKHGAGDVVCKDWKYKCRTTIRSLMSKGKSMWEDSEGWNRLQELKSDL